jgi:hypothetical protein
MIAAVATQTASSQCPYPSSVALNAGTGVTYAACGAAGVLAINGASVTTVVSAGNCPTPMSIVTNNVAPGVAYIACYGGGVWQVSRASSNPAAAG